MAAHDQSSLSAAVWSLGLLKHLLASGPWHKILRPGYVNKTTYSLQDLRYCRGGSWMPSITAGFRDVVDIVVVK